MAWLARMGRTDNSSRIGWSRSFSVALTQSPEPGRQTDSHGMRILQRCPVQPPGKDGDGDEMGGHCVHGLSMASNQDDRNDLLLSIPDIGRQGTRRVIIFTVASGAASSEVD